jgi:hypothetical protein
MTTTYNDLRVRRGYFVNATRIRARTREMLNGLEITPHNPANPANRPCHYHLAINPARPKGTTGDVQACDRDGDGSAAGLFRSTAHTQGKEA